MDAKMLKMLGKKKDRKMDDNEKEAKMNVVKEMRDLASAKMGDKIKGLKKVTVASDSKEGLAAGLDKAEDLLENSSEDGEELAGKEEMDSLENESEESEYADCSPEELDEKIKELMALKQKMQQEKA